MKKFLVALAAISALAAAGQAHAQGYGRPYLGSVRGSAPYSRLAQQFDHAYRGVEHGLGDGSYSRREAQQFYGHIRELRRLLAFYQRTDGFLDRRERRDLERRLDRLHEIMHEAHDEGHDFQDDWEDDDRGDHDHDRDHDRRHGRR